MVDIKTVKFYNVVHTLSSRF